MEYKIVGNVVPAVEFNLKKGEKVYTQSGGMTWKSDGIEMTTDTGGGIKKALGRMISGENLFINHYEATNDEATIAFASTMPGKILPLNITPDSCVLAQSGAFLCAQESVDVSIAFTKNIASGIFGGEGFILQSFSGNGLVFLEVDGDLIEKTLAPGEVFYVNTGNIVCFDKTCQYDVEVVKGTKNLLLGGEGFFITKLVGPGKVVIQTQNFYNFADKILSQQDFGSSNNGSNDSPKDEFPFKLFK